VREAFKHRLIGGAILAAVAVLFLPSFFKDQQHYQVNTESQLPERPVITTVEYTDPVSPDVASPAPAPEAMFAPDDQSPALSSAAASLDTPSQAVSPQTQIAATSAEVAKVAASSSVSELPLNQDGVPDAWVLQVASLSNQSAAEKLRDQLLSQGYRAFIRPIASGAGTGYRIYLGPNLDKAQLQNIKQSLDKQLKVNSLLLPFKP